MSQRPLLLVACCLLAVAGCTTDNTSGSSPDGGATVPSASYDAVECPDDVRGSIFGEVECGLLTVPERRDGTPGTIQVFVTRIQPPGEDSDKDPILVLPGVGTTPNYIGVAPLAQRTGREVIIVDGRGSGHSVPNLDCPEVYESAREAFAVPARDPSVRANYVASVEACADRLRSQGIEPAAFTIPETAADLVDLRTQLGLDSWAAAAYGNPARYLPELMRLDPEAVSAIFLDSPEFPGMDPVRIAVQETPRVIQALLTECEKDQRCSARYPAPEGLWSRARQTVAGEPLHLSTSVAGFPTEVILDEALLIRTARQVVSDSGSSGLTFTLGAVPGFLQAVVDRNDRALSRRVARLFPEQDAFCFGYGAHCTQRLHVTVGSYLSVMCHDVQPFADRANPSADVAVSQVFTARVDPEACSRWDVGEANDIGPPLDWDVPTLVLVGRFAPYTPVADVRRAINRLPAGSLVIDPAGGDNVVGRAECMMPFRNAWLDHPVGDVKPPPCLRNERIDWVLD